MALLGRRPCSGCAVCWYHSRCPHTTGRWSPLGLLKLEQAKGSEGWGLFPLTSGQGLVRKDCRFNRTPVYWSLLCFCWLRQVAEGIVIASLVDQIMTQERTCQMPWDSACVRCNAGAFLFGTNLHGRLAFSHCLAGLNIWRAVCADFASWLVQSAMCMLWILSFSLITSGEWRSLRKHSLVGIRKRFKGGG